MLPLVKDLQQKKFALREFIDLCIRVLNYLPNVLSSVEEKGTYLIYSSVNAGVTKYVRPINKNLFIGDAAVFSDSIANFQTIMDKIKTREEEFTDSEKRLFDGFLYTIQQSIGAGLDLLVDPNSSRKHVGNRFEELVKAVLPKSEFLINV